MLRGLEVPHPLKPLIPFQIVEENFFWNSQKCLYHLYQLLAMVVGKQCLGIVLLLPHGILYHDQLAYGVPQGSILFPYGV